MCDAVELTRQLVRIPSVNPSYGADPAAFCGEGRIADFLQEFLTTRGFQVSRFEPAPERPYLVGFRPGKGRALAFCAHLDTVPVGDLSFPPFDGALENGILRGRGALDDKAGIAAACVAAMAEEGPDVPPILLVLTCDEEFGFTGVEHFVRQCQHASWPEIAGCIVCEPTDGTLILGHKGVYRATLATQGISAHSSTPHLGENAIYAMAPLLQRLELLAHTISLRAPHPQLGTGSLAVGTITGGNAVNAIPASCEVQFDRRMLPGESAATCAQEVRDALDGCSSWTLSEPFMDAPSFCMEAAAPFATLMQKVTAAPVGYVNYATDGSALFYAGIPTVIYGPGNIAFAHTKDEQVSAASIEETVTVYRRVIRALAHENCS